MLLMTLVTAAAHATQAPTSTALVISSNTIQYKSPVILQATVTSNGTPVTTGLVLFCEATAKYCENNSALATIQLSSPDAIAYAKLGSGPLGSHSYKAVYRANNSYASSTSNTVSYTVEGTTGSTMAISSNGTPGSYTLQADVTGIGAHVAGPTGTISFLDTSVGNNSLGIQTLGTATLSTTFAAAGPPFTIGDATTVKSVTIASAYLHYLANNLDIVTGDGDSVITVLQGNGDGTFQPKVNFTGCTTGGTVKMLLADFNRDGLTDLALACSDNGANGGTAIGGIAILLGNGDGSFKAPDFYSTGDAFGMAFGDFNNDGLLDIVVTNRAQQNVELLLGNGDGTFQASSNILATSSGTSILPTTMRVHDVVVGDFNKDGNDDIAYSVSVTNDPSNIPSTLYIATGVGDGTFNAPVVGATNIGEFLTEGDLNGDNKPDIVSSTITRPPDNQTYVGYSLFVMMGVGDGTFQTPVSYLADYPSDPHLADVNGDGKPDIIAGGSYGALVFQGNGDGTFQDYAEPSIGTDAGGKAFKLTYAVNAGDFNNDGNADLAGTDALNPRAAVSLSEVQQGASVAAQAGVSVGPLGSGVHNVVASYSGDGIYAANVSSTIQLLAAPAPTTLTLTVQPTAATIPGQSVTLTATLSPYTAGPPTTTTDGESVSFYSGSTLLGSTKLTSGVATYTTTALAAGTDALQAVYSATGDGNYLPSTSNTVSVTVTGIVVASSLNPSTYLQSVTFTATVAPGYTGTVTFMDGTTSLGTKQLSGTTAALSVSTLVAGAHSITAVYNGDGSHPAVTSPILAQQVNVATPTVGIASSLNPSRINQSVTFTATVSNNATGTITFFDGAVSLGNATLAGGSASYSTSSLSAGPHTITASYGGDTNNGSATSPTLTQTVNKLDPTLGAPTVSSPTITLGGSETITETVPPGVSGPVTFTDGGTVIGTVPVVGGVATITVTTLPVGSDPITASTPGDATNNPATSPSTTVTVNKGTPTVGLSSSLNPSTSDQAVTFTATVTTGATGTVTFLDGSTPFGTGTLVNGQASFTVPTLTVGTHTITASYAGDLSYVAATSAPLTQTVNKGTPVLPPPTVSSTTPPAGSPVTISETVPPGVTGPVTFTDGGTVIGTAPVTGGVATITVTTLPIGSNPITASTPGDANNNPATSPATTVTVTKATPVLPPPTVSSTTPPAGSPVTISETVPPGVTGPVTFSNGGTVIGTAPIVGGVATITVPSLPLGANPITASTPGDATNNPATSPATVVTVAKATPTVALTSSVNPSSLGQSVTFTATVATAASGTVTFLDGATVLGTGAVSAAGVATFSTANLTAGTHTITAAYGGNDSYAAATSAPLAQVVGKAPTTITLTQSQATELLGSTVTFTATVAAGVPTPTGTVSFLDGTTVLGTAPMSTNGTVVTFVLSGNAGYATSTLTTGTHTITATYSGDAGFANSTSAPVTNIVQDFTYTLTGQKTQSIFQGDKTSYTFSVAPVGSTTFMSDVTMDIDGLPKGTTYTFSPATITAGSGTTTVTLSVATSSSSSSSASAANRMPSGTPMPRPGAPIALGVLGLLGLGAVRRHGRKMPRMLMVLLLFLGTLLPVAALSGCAGGYFAPTQTTYSVTATGTEGTIQHSATATLVVQ